MAATAAQQLMLQTGTASSRIIAGTGSAWARRAMKRMRDRIMNEVNLTHNHNHVTG